MKKKSFKIKLNDSKVFEFLTSEHSFTPTGTSEFLIKSVISQITDPGKILDLGCGIGVAGIVLGKLGLSNDKIFLSDASYDAIKMTKKNAKENNIEVDARVGSIFEPWKGLSFDYIIDDISGVAKPIADISPWFNNVSCESGYDGTELIIKVLKQAPKFLNKKGKIFFPVLSLSNGEKIVKEAKKIFKKIKLLDRKVWPLPAQMQSNIKLLKKLYAEGIVDFEEKFGTILWYTDIYIGEL